jgi:lipid II:glycine glycyltransferase (peptidoglycan interpeptide bridge formation enzyme)
VVAAAQARLIHVPLLGLGLAYIVWGPLFRSSDGPADSELFRRALRAIRTEYVEHRRLGLRIAPRIEDSKEEVFRPILEEEGFSHAATGKSYRTLILDLQPTLDDLQAGLHPKWRSHLRRAGKQDLELVSGEEDALLQGFNDIYSQMVDRKGLEDVTDISTVRAIQAKLLPEEKMKVVLCKLDGEVCAGGICSTLGSTGIYLYGATSNSGLKSYGSYLVHWRMLEWVKSQGCRWYDLNGINPAKNPGGYQFKTQFAGKNGREVRYLGQFDCYPNRVTKVLIGKAERSRATFRATVNWLRKPRLTRGV